MSDEKDIAKQKAEQDLDASLRADEARLAALYRKLPQVEPDAQLDARVRAVAQRALLSETAATPVIPTIHKPARWLPALSAAAMPVLASGIAWRLGPQVWPAHNEVTGPLADATSVVSKSAEPAVTTSVPSASPHSPAVSAADGIVTTNAPAAFPAKPIAQLAPSGGLARSDTATPLARAKTIFTPGAAAEKLEKYAEEKPASAPMQMAARQEERDQKQRPNDRVIEQPHDTSERVAKSASLAAAPAFAGVPAPSPAVAPIMKSQNASAAAEPRTPIANCPRLYTGTDWQGHYPPEIPPASEMRMDFVKDMLAHGDRDKAVAAYADFHAHCPQDRWPQNLLDQLGAK